MKSKGFSRGHYIFFIIVILLYTFLTFLKDDMIYIYIIIPFGLLVLILDEYIFENEKTKRN